MTKKSLGYVELQWTCPNCSTLNPGQRKFCNGCGAPQSDDIEFEQAADEKFLSDTGQIARAKAGPDVHCPYCGARNPGDAKYCGACGGDLSAAVARESGRVVGAHKDKPAEEITCPACGTLNPGRSRICSNCGASLKPAIEEPRVQKAEPSKKARKLSLAAVVGVALLLGLAACALFFLFIRTEERTGEVIGLRWERSLPIEALGLVQREGWFDELPADAEVNSCQLEYRYTSDVQLANSTEVCGTPYTVDTGSGFGEVLQECVYEVEENLCTYSVMDWQAFDVLTSTGTDLNPVWPEVNLAEDQREGPREESYEVTFNSAGSSLTYSTSDASEYSQFELGSTWILNVNALGAVVSVESAR